MSKLTDRLFLFSLIVFLSEFAGTHTDPISIFEIELQGFTLGLLEAGCFLILSQTLISAVIHISVNEYVSLDKELRSAISNSKTDEELRTIVSQNPWLPKVRENLSRKIWMIRTIQFGFHIVAPIGIGVTAILWSFPDFVTQLSQFGWPEFRIKE